jgi:hypothetical protein
MSAKLAVAPNTRVIQSDLNSRMLRARYRELAYCRVMRGRAEARGDKLRADFYREDAERARRCIDALRNPRKSGRVVFPEIRAEVKRWIELSEAERAPW